jgi:4-hydroxy-3-methylbut-2-enyl diphosphate reductase
MNSTYFRKGFGLKGAIEEQRDADYHSGLVDLLRARDYSLAVGPLTFRTLSAKGRRIADTQHLG